LGNWPGRRYIIQKSASKSHWGDAIGKRPEDVADTSENLSVWLDNNRRAFAGEMVKEEIEREVEAEKRFYYNVIAPITVDGVIPGHPPA